MFYHEGDQLLNVNGQNFEKLEKDKAEAILKKNTDLTLTVKTNLFGKLTFTSIFVASDVIKTSFLILSHIKVRDCKSLEGSARAHLLVQVLQIESFLWLS